MHDIEFVIETYGDILYRTCLFRLHNEADAEDALQETYLAYMKKSPTFQCEEHRKAWLIRVAINKCRDMLRFMNFRKAEDIDALCDMLTDDTDMTQNESLVLRCLMLLPEKYRSVMLLHFVEEMDYKSIASVIGKTESCIKMRIKKARELFTEIYDREKVKL